jgi:hypothetical protein
MKLKKVWKNNDAFVGIVTAILLIGLIVVIMTIINVSYVPEWIKQQENAHMELVNNQFSQMKYALNLQSLVNDSSVMSSPVTLARTEIPIFDLKRVSGSLQIDADSCSLIINSNTSSSITLTSDGIKGFIPNTYYVQQEYIIEGGTFILRQDDANVLLGKPSLQVRDFGENLTLTFLNITGISGKSFVSGMGTYPVYTEVVKNPNEYVVISNVTNITIKTEYQDAWFAAMNSSLLYSGMNYQISRESDGITIMFIDATGDYYRLFLKEVEIATQIAYGIVEP